MITDDADPGITALFRTDKMQEGILFMLRILLLTAAVTGVPSLQAVAQSLSAADILAKVEEKTGAVNEYQALLNDPDPNRSMAAMEVMLESGDAKLARMALDFGLYSPNPQVRYVALKAFFDGSPNIRVTFDASKVKDQEQFIEDIGLLKGSVNGQKVGFAAFKIIEYDKDQSCYTFESPVTIGTRCLARLSEAGVSLSPWANKWYSLQLNDKGELEGEMLFDAPVAMTVPVSN